MRILVWFAAGFGLACLLGAYWLPGPVLFAFGFCALLMSIGGLILFRNPSGKRSAVIFVGYAGQFGWKRCGSCISPGRVYEKKMEK